VDSAHAPSRTQRRPCLVLHHTARALHAPRPRLPCLLGIRGGLGMTTTLTTFNYVKLHYTKRCLRSQVHPCTLGYMSVAGQLWYPFQNCEHIIDTLSLWYKSTVPWLLGVCDLYPLCSFYHPRGIHKTALRPWHNYYITWYLWLMLST